MIAALLIEAELHRAPPERWAADFGAGGAGEETL